MTTLVGLAFTTPAIAVMVIDRTLFRIHVWQNRPSELHAFLQEQDDRLPIVLVDSLTDLTRISSVEGVHAFLLSEDPRTLFEIDGALVLDAVPDKYSGYKKVMIDSETLNSALLKRGSFTVGSASLASVALRSDITLRELVHSVASSASLDDDFVSNVCLYVVGLLQRRSWVSRVQKPALAAGVQVERLAELEKFIESSPPAEMLWRAYFDHAEAGVPLADVVSAFDAEAKDLDFIIANIGVKKGLKWVRDPREKPLLVKKKRKVRKLKPLSPQGSSMSPLKTARESRRAKVGTNPPRS